MIRFSILCVTILLIPLALFAQGSVPREWLTAYELSNCLRTPRYDETIAYCKRLDAASPWVKYASFGRSAQGRELPLLIVSKDGAFAPEKALRTRKPVLLVQAGIHAGEIDGKDACLMLIRDIAITKRLAGLLDHAILLCIPIFNVDGHERFGPYNRMNQNGPEEMGWRVTAQNLNLNRDYMKADAPEMRAWLRLFNAWVPDFFIDCHVTDGIDMQYDVTYTIEYGPNIHPAVGTWVRDRYLQATLSDVESTGHKVFWYVFPREERDLSKGMGGGATTPRFSTGYAALHNRPGLLIETHMLKPYKTRVDATYEFVRATLHRINETADELRASVQKADEEASLDVTGSFTKAYYPIRFGLGKGSSPRKFLGIEFRTEPSDISGKDRLIYTGVPFQREVPFYDEILVTDSVRVPSAYLIPPEWAFAPEILALHGVRYERLVQPETLSVESFTFADVRFASRPYEGRLGCTVQKSPIIERRAYPAGTVVVRTNQRSRNVAVHLLEPGSGDSFLAWGFFSTIFEQKEYGEGYIIEQVARGMQKTNPVLVHDFEQKVTRDSVFAANPGARVNWWYQRSPYADQWLNKYPVGRVMGELAVKTRKSE
jgi:murein tripeptide amidase MpaA